MVKSHHAHQDKDRDREAHASVHFNDHYHHHRHTTLNAIHYQLRSSGTLSNICGESDAMQITHTPQRDPKTHDIRISTLTLDIHNNNNIKTKHTVRVFALKRKSVSDQFSCVGRRQLLYIQKAQLTFVFIIEL